MKDRSVLLHFVSKIFYKDIFESYPRHVTCHVTRTIGSLSDNKSHLPEHKNSGRFSLESLCLTSGLGRFGLG